MRLFVTLALPRPGSVEVLRSPPAHYVHSKLMAWLALDRALRIAEREVHRSSIKQQQRWELGSAADLWPT